MAMAMVPDNSADRNVALEYSQWKFCRSILRYFLQSINRFSQVDQGKKKYKANITFGRWLMTMQFMDSEQLDERHPLFPRQPLPDNRSKSDLERMLTKGFIMGADDAARMSDELLSKIGEFLQDRSVPTSPEVQYHESQYGGQIDVAEFRTAPCPRIKYLVENFGLSSAALVAMRYDSLHLFVGGESGMSVTALNALRDIGQASYEGFASPLNCRLLGRPGVQFCSLFADTDAIFGSLGSFFRVPMADHPGGWIVNPPFVEAVMEATARRVVETLCETEPGSFWFFVTLPNWKESQSQGWKILDRSERKVARIDFEAKLFIQQDHYGRTFRPKADLSVFVLGQLPEDVDLVRLRNGMCEADEDNVRRDWLEACTSVPT